MKRIITFILAAAMLASILVLSSCGLIPSKVERMANKAMNAKSYTLSYESDNYEELYMVDLEKKMLSAEEDDVCYYLWYDEDEDEYYEAEVEDDEIVKYKLTKEEFADEWAEYVSMVADKIMGYVKLLDLMDEEDGVYSFEYEYYDDNDVTVEIKAEGKELIMEKSYDDGDEYTYKVYDLNKTKVEIPEDVLDAKVEKDN